MGRYFIKFSYIGTQYRGAQKNATSVVQDIDSIQGALESAFNSLLPKCTNIINVVLSSRTDVGVHALFATGHVDLENKYNSTYSCDSAIRFVNRYFIKCDHDIRLLDIVPVAKNFHVNHIIKSRSYLYRFMIPKNGNKYGIPIVEIDKCFHVRPTTFDIERLKNGTRLFMGKKNFTTFAAKSRPPVHPSKFVKELSVLTVEEGQPLMPYDPLSQNYQFWHVTCIGKSFLYNQVRRIVSALLGLGTGVITEKDIELMLQVPGHHNWISRLQPAPPHGLYLASQEIDEEKLNNYIIHPEKVEDVTNLNID